MFIWRLFLEWSPRNLANLHLTGCAQRDGNVLSYSVIGLYTCRYVPCIITSLNTHTRTEHWNCTRWPFLTDYIPAYRMIYIHGIITITPNTRRWLLTTLPIYCLMYVHAHALPTRPSSIKDEYLEKRFILTTYGANLSTCPISIHFRELLKTAMISSSNYE